MRNASKMARYMMMRTTRENGDMRGEGRRGDYTRAEHDGGMGGNYARYSGGMQTGGYMPRYEGGDIESRRGQRRGRDGRFRAEDGNEMRSAYDDDDEEYRMNTIGFGNRDYPEPVYQHGGARIENGGSREMEHRSGMKEHGGAYAENGEFTEHMAKEWTARMKNGDGTTGAHWPMEQVKQLMQQRGINADPAEFFAVLNSVYSDYYTVAKKHNVHNIDFYIDIAKAWLEDKDAVPDKVAAYYECVVKH